jgi:hypothetical protein
MDSTMKKTKMKYGMGGSKMMKSPDPSNYMGNPMAYYNDKAAYGKEIMRQEMMRMGGAYNKIME